MFRPCREESPSPKGATQDSPGQRPADPCHPRTGALKGRHRTTGGDLARVSLFELLSADRLPFEAWRLFPFRLLHGQTTKAKPRSREASKGGTAAKHSRKRKKAEPHPPDGPTSVSFFAFLSADRFPFAALRLGGLSLRSFTYRQRKQSREASKGEWPQRTQRNAKRRDHTLLTASRRFPSLRSFLQTASPLRL
jgi:hypothetical protein